MTTVETGLVMRSLLHRVSLITLITAAIAQDINPVDVNPKAIDV
jgi:hypothetical protein